MNPEPAPITRARDVQERRIEEYRRKIAKRREEIIELTLLEERLRQEIERFQHEYNAQVGRLYVELDRVELEIKELLLRARLVERGWTKDPATIERVAQYAEGRARVLVCLDSNHTHDHVLAELRLYAPFVTVGSYLVVFDTIVEEMPETWVDRPWGKGNNPLSAVEAFLGETDAFVVDRTLEWKALITGSPGGFLRRVK